MPQSVADIEKVFAQKLIPWSEENLSSRIIVARSKMTRLDMPPGITLERRRIPPPRVVVKNKRVYGNVRNVLAAWPDAGMQELSKHSLICITNGFVKMPFSHFTLRMGAGYFIFVPPGIPQSDGSRTYVDLEKSHFCDIATFLLHPGALEFWTSHGHSGGRAQDVNYLVSAQAPVRLFELLIEEAVQEREKNMPLISDLMGAFFHILLRGIQRKDFLNPWHSDRQARRNAGGEFRRHFEDYIAANLHRPIKFYEAAGEMYFSPAQFARIVRREIGMSFVEYLTEKRLQKAKLLLAESEWSAERVSAMCGFSSPEYFYFVFKKHLGVTASQYRITSRTIKK